MSATRSASSTGTRGASSPQFHARGWNWRWTFFRRDCSTWGVDLRGGDAGVSEHLLHLPQVGAAGQQVRGEAVPQRVRADRGGDAGRGCVFLDQFPDRLPPQPAAAPREEQPGRRGGCGRGKLGALLAEVLPNGIGRALAQRGEPLLAPFAVAGAEALLQVQIGQLEVRDLRRPAAGRVEQLQERPVPQIKGVDPLRRGEQPVDHAGREHVGNPLPQLVAANQLDEVFADHTLKLQEAEIHPHRHDVPRHRRRGEVARGEPRHKVAQFADRQPGSVPPAEPLIEPRQIAAVGRHGVLCQPALVREILKKHRRIAPALRPAACRGRRQFSSGGHGARPSPN